MLKNSLIKYTYDWEEALLHVVFDHNWQKKHPWASWDHKSIIEMGGKMTRANEGG